MQAAIYHSPEVFKQFMAPHYRAMVDFFHSHGIDIISVDSDGKLFGGG